MKLIDAIQTRRSTRSFNDEKVPNKIIKSLIEYGNCAPTSCNMQVYKWILIEDKNLLNIFSKKVTGKINWTKQFLILLVDKEITFENNANYLSAGMVVQNLMLAALNYKVSTCPIAGFKGKSILRKKLDIPKRYGIPLLVFIGYENEVISERPYRKSIKDLLSINKFDFVDYFPTTSNLNDWTQSQIIEFRKRIFPVYFPRWRHSVWVAGFEEYWEFLKLEIKPDERVLVFFLWEKKLLNIFKQKNNQISAFDVLEDYNKFLYSKHSINSMLIGDKSIQKSNLIIINHSIIFHKEVDEIFSIAKKSLLNDGRIILSNFRSIGPFSLVLTFARLFNLKSHIYHNSSFYKIGPFRFLSRHQIKKYIEKNDLILESIKPIKTKLAQSKFNNPLIRFFLDFWGSVFNETDIYKIKNLDS